MKEELPTNELYNNEGRVEDIDAAQEMAQSEDIYREEDKRRLLKPRKKSLEIRERVIETVGLNVLEEKKRKKEKEERNRQFRQKRERKEREWLMKKLQENNISENKWQSLSHDEQIKLNRKWKRAEDPHQAGERALEKRLQSLIGKKVSSFEVGDFGDISIRFEDGTTFSFTIFDDYGEKPYPEGVSVDMPSEDEVK